MDYRDYQEQQGIAHSMALADQHDREMELAAPGDGEPCWFGPVTCPVCQVAVPFDEVHNCVWEGDTVRCVTTGNTLTRAQVAQA